MASCQGLKGTFFHFFFGMRMAAVFMPTYNCYNDPRRVIYDICIYLADMRRHKKTRAKKKGQNTWLTF